VSADFGIRAGSSMRLVRLKPQARTPIGAQTAQYNENLQSKTNLGPGISRDKICGLLMMNVSMPCPKLSLMAIESNLHCSCTMLMFV